MKEWSYALLSKAAKRHGGPEDFARFLVKSGIKKGIKKGRVEGLVVGFLSVGIVGGGLYLYEKLITAENIETMTRKESSRIADDEERFSLEQRESSADENKISSLDEQ